MNVDQIIMILSFVLTVAAFAWGLYEKVKGNAAASASAFIAQVESTGLLGKEKMALVVSWLYDLVPAPLKSVLSKEALEDLAQHIFDYMKKYANAYIESHGDKGKEAYTSVNDELAAEAADRLLELGPAGLHAMASMLGVDLTAKSDAKIVKDVVHNLLNRKDDKND